MSEAATLRAVIANGQSILAHCEKIQPRSNGLKAKVFDLCGAACIRTHLALLITR